MADPTTPSPTGGGAPPAAASPEAQLAALEAGLKLHQRIEALTAEIQTLKWERPEEPPWEEKRWLGLLVGFSLLGACVGFITGLSVQQGITEKLLTGVMTFVSGSLLSYGGFRWRRGIEAPRIDPLRVGAGVGGFSAFVIVGVCFGIAARDGQWLVPADALEHVAAGAPPTATPPGATPPTATPPKPDPGLGALRGDCAPSDLANKAAEWRREARQHVKVRNACATWFEPQLGLLHACAEAELNAEADLGDGSHTTRARALIDFGLSLNPEAPDLLELRGRVSP